MNDHELVELLLSNYTAQYGLYRDLLADLNAGIPAPGRAPEMAGIIRVLEARKQAFDRIKAIDDRIAGNKIGWDRRKNEIHTVAAETLKTLLKKIKDILAEVLEASRRLEESVKNACGKE
ncbi:MAG: hypothetical protein V1913_01135 [Fibrobacterota bacterium]